MTPARSISPPLVQPGVRCALAGYGTVRIDSEMIAPLRISPGPSPVEPMPPALLKHADEQTVAGLAAVLQAIHIHGLTTSFAEWGVLAAPRFLGRAALAAALERFAQEGAWGVSPHLIPHRSLHSVSGTVSQALGIHGPNFGTGGGPHGAAEVMFAAAAMISGQKVPGIWVVLTGWHPELLLGQSGSPHRNGKKPPPSLCIGVALAITPLTTGWDGLTMHFEMGTARRTFPEAVDAPRLTLEGLQETLARAGGLPASWRLAGSGWMEIGPSPTARKLRLFKEDGLPDRTEPEAGTENRR